MGMNDRKAEFMLNLVYNRLLEKPTGPYLYEASLEQFATTIEKSELYIRNWFEARREADPRTNEFRPKEISDELNNIVARCIQCVIKRYEYVESKRNRRKAIPEDSSEEGPSEPKPKRALLEKPEEIESNVAPSKPSSVNENSSHKDRSSRNMTMPKTPTDDERICHPEDGRFHTRMDRDEINSNADVLFQIIYACLLEKSTGGPYLYNASLKRLAIKTKKTESYIRNWFEKSLESDRKKPESVPRIFSAELNIPKEEVSDELNLTVTHCIEYAIQCVEDTEFEQNKTRPIPEDSSEEESSEPEPKRARLEKQEETESNAEKTLKFLYYNLLFSKYGPYFYDACLRKLANRIGLTEEEIRKWFFEKRDSQKCSHLQVPEPIYGVSKDKLLQQIIDEAILDEKSIANPKPFQLPKPPSSNVLVGVMFSTAFVENEKENENTRNVKILNYIHTELPEMYDDACILLTDIRFLSNEMKLSVPSIMEWFEARQKGISSEIPVENIRMSETIFEQMCSVETAPSGSTNGAASNYFATSSNGDKASTSADAVLKKYKSIAAVGSVLNDHERLVALDHAHFYSATLGFSHISARNMRNAQENGSLPNKIYLKDLESSEIIDRVLKATSSSPGIKPTSAFKITPKSISKNCDDEMDREPSPDDIDEFLTPRNSHETPESPRAEDQSPEQSMSNESAFPSTSQSPIIEERDTEFPIEDEEKFMPDVETHESRMSRDTKDQEPFHDKMDDSTSGSTAANQRDSESPLENNEDIIDSVAATTPNEGKVKASKSSPTHETGYRTPGSKGSPDNHGASEDELVVDEEESENDDPRNDVEGGPPGMNEFTPDTDEEDNQDSIRVILSSPTSQPLAADDRNPDSPLDDKEDVTDDVADASVNPTPASSAHNARGDDEDVESDEPPANNCPLPEFPAAHGSLRPSESVSDNVEHPIYPAPLVPLEYDPVCELTGQFVTVTRPPPCFLVTGNREWCQYCFNIYEERQKHHKALNQLFSKFI